MTLTLARRADISLETFARVAWQGEEVRVAPEALEVVARRREEFLALVAADPARKFYGVNVHAGDGSDRLMTDAEQRDYSRGLHSATSFGPPLPRRVVRGIVFSRLANMIEGHAAVTPELVALVAARLDGRELAPVPRLGNGGSGEILALGWLFGDVPRELELGVKEGMALINGAPCAPALLADAILCAQRTLAVAVNALCLAVAAYGVSPAIFDERLEALWGDPFQAVALQAIRAGIEGAVPPAGSGNHPQPPVSFRILPRVLGNANRLVAAAVDAVQIALPAVSDNPAFLFGAGAGAAVGDGGGDLGDVVSNGGFHNGAAPACIDGLAFALADLAQLAQHQLQRLQTSPEAMPGLDSLALGTLQMVGAGYAEEARSAVVPSLLPLPGFGHNDVPAPSFHAWNRFDRVRGFVVGSMTCLAVMAAQSFARTGRGFPPALEEFGSLVLEICPPVVERRSVGAELGTLALVLGGGIPE